jgi:hypothetical protein
VIALPYLAFRFALVPAASCQQDYLVVRIPDYCSNVFRWAAPFLEIGLTMREKFSTFLGIARALNRHSMIPVIYGSLGFYQLVGQQVDEIGDIDIVIPNVYLADEFYVLKDAMLGIGYQQDPDFPHEFIRGHDRIGFEPESDLQDLRIDSDNLKLTEEEKVKFKELSLEDYLKVYNKSLATHQLRVSKIRRKIEVIEKLLADREG